MSNDEYEGAIDRQSLMQLLGVVLTILIPISVMLVYLEPHVEELARSFRATPVWVHLLAWVVLAVFIGWTVKVGIEGGLPR